MNLEEIAKDVKIDCTYFGGYKPCKYHKEEGVHCSECSHYEKINEKIRHY